MRVKVTFSANEEIAYDSITKHTIQGFIYNLLRGTPYEAKHNTPGFKFFTFSDIFPSGPIIRSHEPKNLIISSPDREFISVLYEQLKPLTEIKLGPYYFQVLDVKRFNLKLSKRFITGSPIVLYKENRRGIYFSFKREPNLQFFLWRLQDNALKKYNAYYGVDYKLPGLIFDKIVFRKEVALPVRTKTKSFIVIGSLWEALEKVKYTKDELSFYSFIMDCGLGEKNSLGFGFINPVRRERREK